MTNFSNSWTDGIAFCSLLHSYLPDRIDLEMIKRESKVGGRFSMRTKRVRVRFSCVEEALRNRLRRGQQRGYRIDTGKPINRGGR